MNLQEGKKENWEKEERGKERLKEELLSRDLQFDSHHKDMKSRMEKGSQRLIALHSNQNE